MRYDVIYGPGLVPFFDYAKEFEKMFGDVDFSSEQKNGDFTWKVNVPGHNKTTLNASILDGKTLIVKTTDEKEIYRLSLSNKIDLNTLSLECLDGVLTIKAKEKEKTKLMVEIK